LVALGKTFLLDVNYRVAENLPIDLYFVLDFTTTMKNRIKELAGLTKDLSMYTSDCSVLFLSKNIK
jgi:hypothetical protein